MQPDVLFYRSLLQVILEEKFPSTDSVDFQVGRLRKPVAGFREYLNWATKKLKINLEVGLRGLLNFRLVSIIKI